MATDELGAGSHNDDSASAMLGLSRRQRTAVASALTILAVLVIVCTVLGLGLAASLFLNRFSGVFMPLAVGGLAALVVKPYYSWLHERLKLPISLALVAVVLSILVPMVAFGWFFGAILADQISDMFTKTPQWWEQTFQQIEAKWPQFQTFLEQNPWGQRIREVVESQQETLLSGLEIFGSKALSAGGAFLTGIGAMVGWAVLPIYFVFFLIADVKPSSSLEDLLPFFKPETRKDAVYLVEEFVNIVVAFFRGQLVIALLQGVMYAIGYTVIGLKYGFVLGLVLGLLNIVPYLGSIIGLGVGIPLAYFQPNGSMKLVVGVLIVFSVVQLIESYVLTPRIMGDRTGLHPMVIIVAIFFWGSALNGIMGMILAIPLTAFLVVLWRLAKERYIEELL